MGILESIIFGLIQGLTEFLPVSSSGHLALALSLGTQQPSLLYTVLLHMGTLAAVFIVFRRDVRILIIGLFSLMGKVFTGKAHWESFNDGERMAALIIVGTIPLFVAILFKSKLESLMGMPKAIGALLIVNAGILFLSDRIKAGRKNLGAAGPREAVGVGIVQAFAAIMPGISRSGSTITGGLFLGFDREFAFRFSFLLSIPAVLGAGLMATLSYISDVRAGAPALTGADVIAYAAGTAAAVIAGVAAIVLLKILMKRKKFSIFAAYCAIVGVLALILM